MESKRQVKYLRQGKNLNSKKNQTNITSKNSTVILTNQNLRYFKFSVVLELSSSNILKNLRGMLSRGEEGRKQVHQNRKQFVPYDEMKPLFMTGRVGEQAKEISFILS